MPARFCPDCSPVLALVLYRPRPRVLYTLDATAHLAGVTRRSILIYCRAGLLAPRLQPPFGVRLFTDEAIYTVRRMEKMRAVRGLDMAWLAAVPELLDEAERVRARSPRTLAATNFA
jgi:DNA-binding transcriptional MerR regulator